MSKLFSKMKHSGILRPKGLWMTNKKESSFRVAAIKQLRRILCEVKSHSIVIQRSSHSAVPKDPVRSPIPYRWRRPLIFTLTLLLVLLSTGIYEWKFAPQAKAAWYDEDWAYRQTIQVTNGGSALTDYQTSFTLNTAALVTAGKMQSDCDDIRIADLSGNLLPYWIEENNPGCNQTATKVWVKVPAIRAGSQNLFMYYGNAQATIYEDGTAVFPFFDDFNAGSLDGAKWTATGATSFASGAMTITTGSVYSNATVAPDALNYIFEYKNKWPATSNGSYGGLQIANAQGITGGNGGSNKMASLTGKNNADTDVKTYAADGTTAGYNLTSGTLEYTATGNTYGVDGIAVTASQVKFYHNRSLTHGYNGTWSAAPYLYLGYIYGSNSATTDTKDTVVDWVLARKYAATEPTASSLGAEEKNNGPIAHWKLDDGQGQTVLDSTLNHYNGTRGADTTATTDDPALQTEDMCVSGKCLSFDGSNDYVNVASAIPNARTIAFWVRPTTTTASMINLSATAYITATTGTISATGFTSPTIYVNGKAGSTLTANTWQYITVTDTADVNADAITLGKANAAYTTGFIDDVKIYPYARTAAQVRSDYAGAGTAKGASVIQSQGGAYGEGSRPQRSLSDGLVGYWKMDEASWTNDCTASPVLDSSGNGNHGKACPNATGPTGGAAGKFGNAGSFDGSDDYVNAGNKTVYNLAGAGHTISAWLKVPALPAENYATAYTRYTAAGDDQGYTLYMGNTTGRLTYIEAADGGDSILINPTPNYADDTWHLITVTVDTAAKTGRLYVDGALNASDTYTGSLVDYNSSLYLGGNTTSTNWQGSIDETRMYNRALSGDEVKNLYNFAPGPVGYWKMDESSWTNDCATLSVLDSSGSNNNGTSCPNATGPTATTRGRYGRAGNFDGSNDQVSLGSSVNANTTLSVSLWFKASSVPNANNVLFSRLNSDSISGLHIKITSEQQINATWTAGGDNASSTSLSTYPLSTWTHLTVTYDNLGDRKFRIYVNGVEIAYSNQTAMTGSIHNYNNLFIGNKYNTNSGFAGQLDDVKIYNYARTPDQIVEDMNAGKPAGASTIGSGPTSRTDRPGEPVGYWKFDEGQGTAAKNYGNGGTALNGTLTNMAAPATATSGWQATGKYGKSLAFDGTNDLVNVGSNASLNATGPITMSAWVKTSSSGNNYIIGGFDPNSPWAGYAFNIGMGGAGKISYWSGADGSWRGSNSTVNDNAWHYVAVVVSGTTAVFYKDGKADGSVTTALPNSYSGIRTIGARNDGAGPFNGRLDEVKIWPAALTQDDIRADMNAGAALKVGGNADTATAEGFGGNPPVAWWKMDEASWTVNCSTASVLDSSGNNNNGIACPNSTGPTGGAKGKIGKAGSFDGSNDYVSAGTGSSLDVIGSDFSVAAWVLTNQTGSTRLILQKGSGPAINTDKGYSLYLGNVGTQWTFGIWDGTSDHPVTAASTYKVETGVWHYLTGVFVASTKTGYLYIDGLLKGQNTNALFTTPDISTNPLAIGASGAFNTNWNGKIDQVRVYDYARSQAQVAYDYNRGLPIGWWKFNECNDTAPGDSSGNAATGTLNLAAGTITSAGDCATNPSPSTTSWYGGKDGKWNSSIKFDGTDDNVSVADDDRYTFGGSTAATDRPMSLSVWTNLVDATSAGLISKYATNQREYQLYTDASDKLYAVVWDDSASAYIGRYYNTALTSTLEGAWHLITMTYDGSATAAGIKLYLDGKQIDDTDYASGSYVAMENKTATVTIGKSDTLYANGQLDDARVYNYALTAAQIRTVMNEGGAVRYGPTSGMR